MIKVTTPAVQSLTDYFKDKEAQPIRVHLIDGGCSGLRLSLALDEKRDGDLSVEHEGFVFVVNGELSEAAGEISIDMTEYGFTIDSANPVGGGGCGCSGGSCGTGSGGCGC